MKEIAVRRGKWGNESALSLRIPAGWDVSESAPVHMPALEQSDIAEKIRKALDDCPSLSGSLEQKKVLLVVDDLWRPTPADAILRALLTYLTQRGVRYQNMHILIACGAHEKPALRDIGLKVGEAQRQVAVSAHDCRADAVYLCRTDAGTPLCINQRVMDADVRILVGGMYPHPIAGFSGGYKLLVPGVCGLRTIVFLHDMMRGVVHRGDSTGNEFRREITSCAQKVGPSVLVNAALNSSGHVAELFCGDPQTAFGQAERFARDHYKVGVLPEDTDIVVVEGFPFDMSYNVLADRALWPLQYHRAAKQIVVIADCSHGVGSHALDYSAAERIGRRLSQFARGDFKGCVSLVPRLMRRLCCAKGLPPFTLLSCSPGLSHAHLPRRVRLAESAQDIYNDWLQLYRNGTYSLGLYRTAGLTYCGV